MKLPAVLLWTLAGGFAASTAVNAHLALRLEDMEATSGTLSVSPAETPAELQPIIDPAELSNLDALGLSTEQSERIRGCSMI